MKHCFSWSEVIASAQEVVNDATEGSLLAAGPFLIWVPSPVADRLRAAGSDSGIVSPATCAFCWPMGGWGSDLMHASRCCDFRVGLVDHGHLLCSVFVPFRAKFSCSRQTAAPAMPSATTRPAYHGVSTDVFRVTDILRRPRFFRGRFGTIKRQWGCGSLQSACHRRTVVKLTVAVNRFARRDPETRKIAAAFGRFGPGVGCHLMTKRGVDTKETQETDEGKAQLARKKEG